MTAILTMILHLYATQPVCKVFNNVCQIDQDTFLMRKIVWYVLLVCALIEVIIQLVILCTSLLCPNNKITGYDDINDLYHDEYRNKVLQTAF